MKKNIIKDCLPLPFCYQRALEDGVTKPQHKSCRKCSQHDCVNASPSQKNYFECSKGFSCIPLSFMGENIILNGLIQYPTNNNFPGKLRKNYKPYIVTEETIKNLQLSLSAIEKDILEIANERVKDSVSSLHDIRTSVGIVLSWCQKIIDKEPGNNFEEKLTIADYEMKNLFTSIKLLQEQLSLADIIANPESISVGKMHRSKIHGFIYKHVKLFEPRADEKGCNIPLRGHTEAEIEAYNSFQFIPLILLDNAVKYSAKKYEIIVQLREQGTDITLTVSSYGRIVPTEYREKIFEKYFRGPNVDKEYPSGMGIGLYIAQLIAEAHGTSIFYSCNPDSGAFGMNEFGLTMKMIDQTK